MRIYMGADHAGYPLKEILQSYLKTLGHDPVDLGTFNEEPVDYPDFAREVSEKVYENPDSLGLLVCGSGTGMCIAANKHIGIRAASVTTPDLAKYARAHNDANVLCLGARFIQEDVAREVVKVFLETSFEDGRHSKRVEKIKAMEQMSLPKSPVSPHGKKQ